MNIIKRKYLDDINITSDKRPDGWCPIDDKRQEAWRQEREEYGFDDKEMWSLDFTFYLWLYERLKYFLEYAPINTEYHKLEYDGYTLTQKECIQKMIDGCYIRLTKEDYDMDDNELKMVKDVAFIWALVLPYMWY